MRPSSSYHDIVLSLALITTLHMLQRRASPLPGPRTTIFPRWPSVVVLRRVGYVDHLGGCAGGQRATARSAWLATAELSLQILDRGHWPITDEPVADICRRDTSDQVSP